MKRVCALSLLALCPIAIATLPAQQPPQATELTSDPFAIKNTWIIGGSGSWDYLTMDSGAERLYIAHGHSVQVVDVKTGTLAGAITDLVDAHAVALDDTGEFGYVSDGRGGKVIVFDRRTLQTVATIEDVASPRALVFEPQTRLLFAIRFDLSPAPRAPAVPRTTTHITPRPAPPPPPAAKPNSGSSITIIDTQTRKIVGQIVVPEVLGFALADGRGNVFVNATDRNRILQFDAQTVAALLPKPPEGNPAGSATAAAARKPAPPITIDWTARERPLRSFSLDGQCTTPKSLAIDAAHLRLFEACNNLKLLVLNADNGSLIAALPIGSDVDALGYDANNGLIYSASGGADGSLTIIRQSVSDSYAVIQNLPTRQRARTLAVDPETGQVYLVTDLLGMDLSHPGNVGTLQTDPVNGSFQVLVVGH
jgi:DNA-binding beta-propeller fold protein YncE